MNRRQWAWLAVGTGALAAGAGWRLQQQRSDAVGTDSAGRPVGASPETSATAALPASAPGTAPDSFWAQSVERPDGTPMPLASFKGRPLLINFWATWCAPCIREMPLIDAFAREQAAAGWQVLGLAIDRRDAVAQYLRDHPVSYAIGLAGFDGTEWSRELGNPQGALPFTVVFDAQGRIRHRKLGEIHASDLASWARA